MRLATGLPLVALLACDGSQRSTPRPAQFGLDVRPANARCLAPARPPPSTVPVKLERVFANVKLESAMVMAQTPGDRSRWFVAERKGPGGTDARIVSFDATHPEDEPSIVATLGPLADVTEADGEGGLLGMAFHPRFAANGRVYVSWVKADPAAPNGARSAVGYLTSTDGGAHFRGYRDVFAFDQTASLYHKGGGVQFGPDGLLYASFGDGGTQDDRLRHGQSGDGFFAKIHRIDVDHQENGKPYAIPDGNPFKDGGGQDTTFAWGFRNPFRFSIDRQTNLLWVGDVGQDRYEEIDVVEAGGNYGWPCREGAHDHVLPPDPRCPSTAGLVAPVAEQAHDGSTRAVVGGVVYRGKALPALVGSYVYGDFARRELWAAKIDPSSTGAATSTWLNESGTPQAGWVDVAEDVDGEIYVLGLEGVIYKLVEARPQPDTFPDRLSKTGCVDPNAPRSPAPGLIPYGVSSPLWSDGADKERFMALPDATTIAIGDDGHFEFPIGTVLMKSFRLGGKLVETRLLMRHDDGAWAGYSYEWLDDQSDALLLSSSKQKRVGEQTWYYPARGQCLLCHNKAAGQSLGPELRQLGGDFVYATTGRVADQLETLEHVGMFSAPLPAGPIVAYPDPHGTAPIDQRARAYLHANCSMCHRPDGPGIVDMDLRISSALDETRTCNVEPTEGDLGIAGAKRLVPGAPQRSMLSIRAHAAAVGRMPPLASSVVDDKGVAVIDDWIESLESCREVSATAPARLIDLRTP
ncbi:MAG: hypothetical protein JWN44_399 [Myxococcales bacterium]|nr:hypothetical protein [Myxococcales bacterium]